MKFVLDAYAFINLGEIDFVGEIFTTYAIDFEIRGFRTKLLLEAKKVQLRAPTKASMKETKEQAKITGDLEVLSEADLSVIALALDLKANIVTDDFDIQNLCLQMNIPFFQTKTRIKKKFKRRLYCDKCKKTKKDKVCEVCGAETRPKVVKVENINNSS